MTATAVAAAAVFRALILAPPPHAVDEYLQATMISISANEVHGAMRLIPGVQVFPKLLRLIDANHDGVITPDERDAYVRLVMHDVVLRIDGATVTPTIVSATMPTIADMTEGVAAIRIEFTAPIASTPGAHHLTFENHHQSSLSAFLVNVLVPEDSTLHLGLQTRNVDQSVYQLDFRNGAAVQRGIAAWWDRAHAFGGVATGFPSMFRLGVRHIAEGTDHLLFLLTLLLPAPLIAIARRWRQRATVHETIVRIVKIVSAFTVGHSITLALAAFGLIHVPSRPIEVLIAVSILVSAVHAFRPVFAGREPMIAAGFGLVHGLGFAAAINPLGLGWSERFVSILAFNLGIETMQLLVIGLTLPSLVLLSRTPAYGAFRIGGASFAALAAALWIVERISGVVTPVDVVVNAIAHSAPWLAAGLFGFAVAVWLINAWRDRPQPDQAYTNAGLRI